MITVENKPGLSQLTADMFRCAIGKAFVFKRPVGEDGAFRGYVELKLVEVKSFEHCGRSQKECGAGNFRAPFSLLFELVDGMQPLAPGLHRIEHSNFLPEDWHIARVQVFGRDPAKAYYESVFA